MMSTEKIRQVLMKANVRTREATDTRILADASAALAQRGTRSREASGPRWWRVGAIAATVLVACLLGLVFLGNGNSIALADVKAAVNGKSWVHVQNDDGTEVWVSLSDGKSYHKRQHPIVDGKVEILFIDNARNIRRRYWEGDVAIYEDEPAIYEDGKVPEWKRETPWEYFLGWYEKRTEKPDKHGKTEKHEETIDGKKLVRFDNYHTDALGKNVLDMQIWADIKTRLPVRTRWRKQVYTARGLEHEWVTTTYDFPVKGPASIYALGVPRGLPVVKTDHKYLPKDVQALLAKARAARDHFPTNYRAVIWSNDRNSDVGVIYRSGMKYRSDSYSNMGKKYPRYHLSLPASVEQVLTWCLAQRPMDITVFDGERRFRRTNPFPDDVPGVRREAITRVYTQRPESFFHTGKPPVRELWPFLNRGAPAEILPHPEEAPVGCIALRFGGSGSTRQDYYVNPKRDYICVKWVYWRKRDGFWSKEWEDWLLDFRRLPGRQLYATRRLRIQYGDPKSGIGMNKTYEHIDVKILKDNEFPPGIFDGKKLLEGSKVVTN